MEYFKATGQINVSNTAFNMNPSKKHDAFLTAQTIDIPKMLNDKAYVAYLGHEKGKMSIGHDITGDIAVNANLDTGSITGAATKAGTVFHKAFKGLVTACAAIA